MQMSTTTNFMTSSTAARSCSDNVALITGFHRRGKCLSANRTRQVACKIPSMTISFIHLICIDSCYICLEQFNVNVYRFNTNIILRNKANLERQIYKECSPNQLKSEQTRREKNRHLLANTEGSQFCHVCALQAGCFEVWETFPYFSQRRIQWMHV